MSDIQGSVDPKFQSVADRFAQNFDELDEVGASLCLSVEGETVVDLWGGYRDARRTVPWDRDTISIVFSCTKAATALCAQILVDRGLLDLDAPVARYWPEFGTAGKENATVAMLLNHTVGLPALRAPVPKGGFADWDDMCARYAAETPFWDPGTQNGYHMISFGWLVGEVVRRVSGQSLGAFFASEVADPLGLPFWIGLPEAEDHRLAPVIFHKMTPEDPRTDFMTAMLSDMTSMQALSMLNLGGLDYNDPALHRAEIGGAGGIANARGICGMFTPLANGGGDLLSRARIDAMRAPSVETRRDANLLMPTRFGQGFMLAMDNRAAMGAAHQSFVIGPGAFGHVGAGGSCGFADPEARMSFAYTMNKMGNGLLMNPRGQGLIDAAYAAL